VIRVLSGAALIVFAVLVVWFAPAVLFLLTGEVLLLLAFVEYVRLARASGFSVPPAAAGAASVLTCAAFAGPYSVALDAVLMSALVVLGAMALPRWRGGSDALGHVAASLFPIFPVRLVMRDPFRSDQRIGRLKVPLLVMHGARDPAIPIAFGERLFALAHEPKQFVRFPEGGHNDLDAFGATAVARQFIGTAPLR